jgi:hypothetical protein
MSRQNFDERQVGLRVSALENVLEIPNWLVRMNQKSKLEFRH